MVDAPVAKVRVKLEFPSTLDVSHKVLGVDLKPRESIEGDGGDACVKKARSARMHAQTTDQLLLQTANSLVQHRYYSPAHDIYKHLAKRYPQLGPELERIATLSRDTESLFAQDDPRSVVVRSLMAGLKHGEFHSRVSDLQLDKSLVPGSLSRRTKWVGLIRDVQSTEAVVDFVSSFEYQKQGSDEVGYRVRMLHKTGDVVIDQFVVQTDDGYRLLHDMSQLGQQAVSELKAGDIESANRWLKWAARVADDHDENVNYFDAFAGSPFHRLRLTGLRKPEKMWVAAAALATNKLNSEEAVEILSKYRDKVEKTDQLQVDRALLRAHAFSNDFEAVLKLSEQLCESHPNASELLFRRVGALVQLGRVEDALGVIEDKLGSSKNVLAQIKRIEVLLKLDRDEDARRLSMELVKKVQNLGVHDALLLSFPASHFDLIGDDYQASLVGTVETDFSTAAFANMAAGHGNAAVFLVNARHFSKRFVNADDFVLYAKGRLAEHCGLDQLATGFYEQASKKEIRITKLLASKRLKELSAESGELETRDNLAIESSRMPNLDASSLSR